MTNGKFVVEINRYPIAVRLAMGKDRRIRLPKILAAPLHYVLVEKKRAGQPWLGICGPGSLVELAADNDSLRILAEYRTCRPALPKAACARHDLQVNKSVWLVITGNWIEIVPESDWLAETPELD